MTDLKFFLLVIVLTLCWGEIQRYRQAMRFIDRERRQGQPRKG